MTQVLVVDDDEPTRNVLRLLLEESGYPVSEARDGVSALEAIRYADTPLVVILDLDLPRMNGGQILEAVSLDPALARRHRFILLTALGASAREATLSIRQDLDAPLMPKPFDILELVEMVAKAERALTGRA